MRIQIFISILFLTVVSASHAGTYRQTYDHRNQLTKYLYTPDSSEDSKWSVGYSYDNVGNRRHSYGTFPGSGGVDPLATPSSQAVPPQEQ